jgi:predicted phage terminase large subunit-like protein
LSTDAYLDPVPLPNGEPEPEVVDPFLTELRDRAWLRAEKARLDDMMSVVERSRDEAHRQATRRDAILMVMQHPAYLQMLAGWNVEPFHWNAFNAALLNREHLWLAPRGSGKSTSLAVFHPAWLALADPDLMHSGIQALNGGRGLFPLAEHPIGPWNIRQVLTSNSAPKAEGLHWQVKAVMKQKRVRALFGDLEGRKWKDAESETIFKERGRIEGLAQVFGVAPEEIAEEFARPEEMEFREGTFTAMGLGSKVTGGHYDACYPDDWVTEDNARTETQRQKLVDFWGYTVSPTREPWARTTACGTRYHPADWYHTLVEMKKQGTWQSVHRDPALIHAENAALPIDFDKPDPMVAYWPEVWSVPRLLEKRLEIGPVAFATQYQNETDLLTGDFWTKATLENFGSFMDLPKHQRDSARIVIACDPAIKGGPKNDFTAFVVIAYVQPHFYVIECRRGQYTEDQLIANFKQLADKHQPYMCGIEIISGLEWVVPKLRRALGRWSLRTLIPSAFKGKDKVGRASTVRGFFDLGRVFLAHPKPENGIGRLIEEMMAFPNASDRPGMDDCVDALVWAMIMFTLSRTSFKKMEY